MIPLCGLINKTVLISRRKKYITSLYTLYNMLIVNYVVRYGSHIFCIVAQNN